jgi:hypothetical protein
MLPFIVIGKKFLNCNLLSLFSWQIFLIYRENTNIVLLVIFASYDLSKVSSVFVFINIVIAFVIFHKLPLNFIINTHYNITILLMNLLTIKCPFYTYQKTWIFIREISKLLHCFYTASFHLSLLEFCDFQGK